MLDFLKGSCILILYFLLCACTALLIRTKVKMPKEVFRKTLHFILVGSVFVFTYAFPLWWQAAAASLLFAIVVYPILCFGEKFPAYSKLLTERCPGEIKRSLRVVFTMFSLVITLCWGWQGEKYLVIAAVLAWGVGDAAAALIGKGFGRYPIQGRWVEGTKTLEGTLGMFFFSSLSVFIVFLFNSPVAWWISLIIAAITGAVTALVELNTKNGMDTITCPLVASGVMILLLAAFGG